MKAELVGGSLPPPPAPPHQYLLPHELYKGLCVYRKHTRNSLFELAARSLKFLKFIGSLRHNPRIRTSLAREARVETFLLSSILIRVRELDTTHSAHLLLLPSSSSSAPFHLTEFRLHRSDQCNEYPLRQRCCARFRLLAERLPAESLFRARFSRQFFFHSPRKTAARAGWHESAIPDATSAPAAEADRHHRPSLARSLSRCILRREYRGYLLEFATDRKFDSLARRKFADL